MKEKLKRIRANIKYCSFLSRVRSSGESHVDSNSPALLPAAHDFSLDLAPLHNSPWWISHVDFRFQDLEIFIAT